MRMSKLNDNKYAVVDNDGDDAFTMTFREIEKNGLITTELTIWGPSSMAIEVEASNKLHLFQ